MMLLAKLKTAAIAVLAVAMIAGGFGVQHAFADEPQPQAVLPNPVAVRTAEPHPDDVFLRRMLLDLTGAAPTRLEFQLFRTDADANKRAKVIDWLVADDRVKASLAKRLGVAIDRIQIARNENLSLKSLITIGLTPDETAAVHGRVARFTTSMIADANIEGAWTTAVLRRVKVNSMWTELLNTGEPPAANFLLQDQPIASNAEIVYYALADAESQKNAELEFLKEAVQAARGNAPTPLEERYYTEDKDPKKREKLLEELLKDPATARKLGAAWKAKMLEPKPVVGAWRVQLQPNIFLYEAHLSLRWPDKLEALVDSLIAAKKTDEQILEAVTLAAASRLPTAEEKKATLAVVGALVDKKTAWVAIAKALTPAK